MTNDSPQMIAVCPRCRAMLALPAEATAEARLECPSCDERFGWVEAARPLQRARLVMTMPPQPQPLPPVVIPSPSWSLPDLAASGVHVWEPPSGVEIEFDNYPKPAPTPVQEPEHVGEPVIERPLAAATPTPVAEAALPATHVDPAAATVPIAPADTVRLEKVEPPSALNQREAAEPLNGDGRGQEVAVAAEPAEIDLDDQFVAPFATDDELQLRSDPPQRRRRATGVGTLVGIIGGGVGGLLLGGYGLLWLRDGEVDVFKMGRWLPNALLPTAMHAPADDAPLLALDKPAATRADAPPPADDAPNASSPAEVDPDVSPVAAAEPQADAGEAAAPEAPPDSETRWPVTPILGSLTDARLYSLEELTDATDAGRGAAARFAAGDLTDPESVRDMGLAYIELCALAERLTLTNPTAFGSALFTQQALAKEALRSTAAPSRRGNLDLVAGRWLEHERRKNDGVVFAGRVNDLRAVGRWTEYLVEVTIGDNRVEIPVLLDKLKYGTGDDLGVAGVIVTNPQLRIAGYEGDAPLVVVAGEAFDPATVSDEAPAAPADAPLLGE